MQVPKANVDQGHPNTRIAPGYALKIVAQGTDVIENPSGPITTFGRLSDNTATEPDQNLYLVFASNPGGPSTGFDYGRHFIFQGHENGDDLAYVTRVNLDVRDATHKVTLLTPVGSDGLTHFNSVDGSTFDPYTNTLLFTQEDGSSGGVIQISSTWPAKVSTLDGIFGKGGFEGIHVDNKGDIYIAEDAGGVTVNVDPNDPNSPKVAKQPNSFLYRFLPYNIHDLSQGGKLQALQVSVNGQPVIFHADDPSGDVFSINQLLLNTPGTSYPSQWITVHDTAVDGTDSFDANAAAKTALGTPFKRPENLAFLPGSNFATLYFSATGDTDSLSGNVPDLAARGAWGSIFRVNTSADGKTGSIGIFVLGDSVHNSFDNLTFADSTQLLAAEDRGNTLHSELNTLDSIWSYPVGGTTSTLRFVSLGRDTTSETEGEDNEPTGVFVSSGGTHVYDLLGTPAGLVNARGFFTMQHGDNKLYEIVQKF
ncbi:MAG: hypothetical protein H0X25_00535 [Acidobacteriales bacterium]|nr:hypothetical protein [Terriglobales bacterium]